MSQTLTITHTTADGTLLDGSRKGDGVGRHIAGDMREESAALGLARWAVDPLTGAAPAAEGHPVRVIRPAYTIEQGARVVLDGDTVTVLDVDRDDTARTVTLTTSYGAPRTVTRDAAVPVVSGG